MSDHDIGILRNLVPLRTYRWSTVAQKVPVEERRRVRGTLEAEAVDFNALVDE